MPDPTPSAFIDARIASLNDWRGETLARVRTLIRQAVPDVIEEVKWRGTPVWSHGGILCTGETYKTAVKLTFAKGAMLPDPAGLFNSSLEGNTRRAIDIREGETLDPRAFADLIRAAAEYNGLSAKEKRERSAAVAQAKPAKPAGREPILLSGGNPQIAKGDGDAPVQAYIAALDGWKRDLTDRIDALVTANVPSVRKAVKWNSPFYGLEGQGWLLNVHVFTKYVKVLFFAGTALTPVPPGGTRDDGRWLDIYEGTFDEPQLIDWIRQAAILPGWGKVKL